MDAKKLKEDLEKVYEKHGLKAVDEGEGEKEEEAKPEEAESKEEEAKEEEEKASTVQVIADLSEKISTKLADAVAKKKSFSEKDEKDYGEHLRSKILMPNGELKEVSYPSDLGSLTKEEKIVTFFKSLMYAKTDHQSAQVLRALVEGTTTLGGYLVPEELKAEIFRILPDFSVMRRIGRVIPMNTDTLKLNSLAAGPAAYWTSEYASKSTTSAEFDQTEYTPHDLVCLLPVTDQLIADANINIVQFIIEIFTETIGREEDKAFFAGSGTGRPKGINQESLTSVAAGGNISFDNILALIDSVAQRVTQSGTSAFVGNRRVKRYLRLLKDGNSNYIWRDGGTAPGGGTEIRRLPDTIYSYPFYEQNDLAGSELYFGDWRYYIIADRQSIEVRTTQEGGDAWRRNATEIKAVERVDGKVVITAPFAKITGA